MVSGARSWKSIIVDPVGSIATLDLGRDAPVLQEGDPFLTRTTTRPTATPTISPEPTAYPSLPFPSSFPSAVPSVPPSLLASSSSSMSSVPSTSLQPSKSATPSQSAWPSGSLTPSSWGSSYAPVFSTSAPSGRGDQGIGYWRCAKSEVLHEIILYDQFGDGWNDLSLRIERLGDTLTSEVTATQHVNGSQYLQKTTVYYSDGASKTTFLRINNSTYPVKTAFLGEEVTPGDILSPNPVFQDTLESGDVGIRYACLQPGRCYRATILGGRWADEIHWEARQSTLAQNGEAKTGYLPLVNGGAPSNCTFLVPSDGTILPEMFCPSECHITGQEPLQTSSPSSTPVIPLPTWAPTQKEYFQTTTTLQDFNASSVSINRSESPTMLSSAVPSSSLNLSDTPSIDLSSEPSNVPTLAPSKALTVEPSTPRSSVPTSQSARQPTSSPTSSAGGVGGSPVPTLAPSNELTVEPSTPRSSEPTSQSARQPTSSPTSSAGGDGGSPVSVHEANDDDLDHNVGDQDGDGTSVPVKPAYNGGGDRDSL